MLTQRNPFRPAPPALDQHHPEETAGAERSSRHPEANPSRRLYRQWKPWAVLLLCLGCAGFAGAGCASIERAVPEPLAAVEIQGNTPGQIGDVAAEVFRDHGYEVIRHGKTSLTFEKPGSKLSNFAYGDWMSGSSVWLRVEASIVPAGEAAFRLQCEAHLVANKGEPTEEPVKYAHPRNAPIQALVEQVAKRLRNPANPPSAGESE